MLDLEIRLGRPAIVRDQESENHALIILRARETDPDRERPGVSIMALLDASSSMRSRRKMVSLKEAVTRLISNLKDTDRLGLVMYASSARLLMGLTRMTPQNRMRARDMVRRLIPNGTTNMSRALELGYAEFQKHAPTQGVNRIILFTDGCPTSGLVRREALVRLAGQVPPGVRLTAMGYGRKTRHLDIGSMAPESARGLGGLTGMDQELNMELLEDMARAGKGSCYYMSDPESCGKAFGKELAGLLTVVARQVRLELAPAPGVVLDELMDDAEVRSRGNDLVLDLPDMIASQRRQVLVRCRITPGKGGEGTRVPVLRARLSYVDAIQEEAGTRSAKLDAVLCGPESDSLSAPRMDPEVETQLRLVEFIRAQELAYELAEAGKFSQARDVFYQAVTGLRETGSKRGMELAGCLAEAGDCLQDARGYLLARDQCRATLNGLREQRTAGGGGDSVFATPCQTKLAGRFAMDHDSSETPAAPGVSARVSAQDEDP